MNAAEFFRRSEVALPRQRAERDFAQYLSELFDLYLETVDGLNDSCHLGASIRRERDTIDQIARHVLAAARLGLQDRSTEARGRLRSGLSLAQRYLERLLSLHLDAAKLGVMYRMRFDAPTEPTRADLFHVPFQLRHRIAGCRYSIAGVPCLYVSGSLRCCWLELGGHCASVCRPVTVAVCQLRCREAKKIRVLNLAYRPSVVAGLVRSVKPDASTDPRFAEIITGYAVSWPLLAACSIRRTHHDNSLKPEHAIPQMLIEWVREEHAQHGWDGIRYFSTRMEPSLDEEEIDDSVLQTANFAFPTRTSSAKGHCEHLLEKFVMSEPISMRIENPAAQLSEMESRLSLLPDSAFSDVV